MLDGKVSCMSNSNVYPSLARTLPWTSIDPLMRNHPPVHLPTSGLKLPSPLLRAKPPSPGRLQSPLRCLPIPRPKLKLRRVLGLSSTLLSLSVPARRVSFALANVADLRLPTCWYASLAARRIRMPGGIVTSIELPLDYLPRGESAASLHASCYGAWQPCRHRLW